MTRIKYGHLISEASGKLNGSVFTRSSGTPSLRAKTSSVNRTTATMRAQRSHFSTIARAWSALTAQQRTDWQAYAVTTGRVSSSGRPLTGQAAFCQANLLQRSFNAGVPIITTPTYNPVTIRWISLTFSASAATQTFALNRQFTGGSASQRGVYFYSPPLSPGQTLGKTKLYRIASGSLNATGTIDQAQPWKAKFGPLLEGQTIKVRVQVQRATSVLTGAAFECTGVVGP